MRTQWRILIVDDEPVMCESLKAWLMEDGYEVDAATGGREALELAHQNEYDIYFIDLKMPGMDGIEAMRELKKLRPAAAVVIITAYATVDTAVAAMKLGAHDYVMKPCNPQEISLIVERLLKMRALQRENLYLKKKLAKRNSFHDIVSKDPGMHRIFDLIRDIAGLRSTVLILGESGTGKEMIARAIHEAGDRTDKPFVAVSCGALTETLLESELFGYEKGAFTGAQQRKKGKFELADGGTILLDEIGDISPKLQVDLLRVLQERSFYRVGGSEELHVDVRVIAATKQDVEAAVREGKFRDDLYYRLNVITVNLPPLRKRLGDVALLAKHFAQHLALDVGRDIADVSEDAIRLLMGYDWPGNVRELENAVERAIVTSRGTVLEAEHFAFLRSQIEDRTRFAIPPSMTLQELEKLAITTSLTRSGWNVKETATALGIDRSTLYDKLKRYGLERPE